ncbi:MAG: hypothetical protein IIY70_03955 [Oscillospiraceae bacterium]|nr:hypothetical protein [Oscillospiraceae bacterium]
MAWNESLEALKGLVAEAAQAATRVAKSTAAVTKSNISLLAEQDKLKKAYQELGKLYYRDFITGEEPDEAEYLPLCNAITEATKNIELLRDELEDAKASFGKPEKEAQEPAPEVGDLEEELTNLNKELDELEKDLSKLDGVEEKAEEVEQSVQAVFEVVEDQPAPPIEKLDPEEKFD